MDAFLDFDPAMVQVLEIIPGDSLATPLTSAYDNERGRIVFAAGKALNAGGVTGSFRLAIIRLQAMNLAGCGRLAFVSAPPVRITNAFSRGESILGSTSDGIVIPAGATTPTVTIWLPYVTKAE